MQTWFNWNNKKNVLPGLWILHDFLTPEIFHKIKEEIKTTPAEWHTRYHGREISEHGDYPLCRELAGRLIPYMHGLFSGNYKCITVRAYRDHPGSYFFPHLDGKEFAVNVQIYMPASDRDELGTQWCMNDEHNALAELDEHGFRDAMQFNENDFFTVPFKANWGYINLNSAPRRIHKTLKVPVDYIRESIHFNFGLKQWPVEYAYDAGQELDWYRRIGIAVPVDNQS